MAPMEIETTHNPNEVQAAMNYLADPGQKPVSYMYKPPAGAPQRSWHVSKHPMAIHNARILADELSLDREGFILTHQNSAVKNFYDDGEVRSVYYPEVERMVKQATGAVRVLVFDHNVRRGTSGE